MRAAILLLGALAATIPGQAADPTEYQLKAAFIYNFALFTEWPAEVGGTLKLCIHGRDPFGPELDQLQGEAINQRRISIERKPRPETLDSCQVLFIPRSAAGELRATVERLRGKPVLIIAESADATAQGAMLNMSINGDKITFAANVKSAQQSRLGLSSKLLKLATEVVR